MIAKWILSFPKEASRPALCQAAAPHGLRSSGINSSTAFGEGWWWSGASVVGIHLKKPLLFVKRFTVSEAFPPTPAHRTVAPASRGGPDEKTGVQGWEWGGFRSQRVGSRDRTALDLMHAGWRFFLKVQPVSRVWPGFAVEVAGETGGSVGPADLGCVGPQDTPGRASWVFGRPVVIRALGGGRCRSWSGGRVPAPAPAPGREQPSFP